MVINTVTQLAVYSLVVGFIMTFVVITGFAYTTLLERKLLARLQHRVGPNRAGYIPIPTRGGKERKLLGGFMQPAADAVKLFFKEDLTPVMVDKWTYFLAPIITVIPAIFILAVIPWAGAKYPLPDEYRIYARAASDDKGPIVAMLAALDALRAAGIPLSANLKFFLEGEEEAGSPNLARMLAANRELLAADLWIFGDGPIDPRGLPRLALGVRGITTFRLTVYGPATSLHSGHYGNVAPNPAARVAELIASMRAPDGRITIAGLDVPPPTAAQLALAREGFDTAGMLANAGSRPLGSALERVRMIVDVRLVAVLTLLVLVGGVSVVDGRVVVLVLVASDQVLHIVKAAARAMVGDVHVLVVVQHAHVTMGVEL